MPYERLLDILFPLVLVLAALVWGGVLIGFAHAWIRHGSSPLEILGDPEGSAQRAWQRYQEWLRTEAACQYCRRQYNARPRNAEGKCTDVWLTETDCGCLVREQRGGVGKT